MKCYRGWFTPGDFTTSVLKIDIEHREMVENKGFMLFFDNFQHLA